jgi:hypothetical protein
MLISKETLIGAAALGAGAVAAKVVQNKVIGKFLPTTTPIQRNLITLAAGIFTPQVVRGPVGTGLGAGMIAASVAGIVDPYLQNAGLTGASMGQVLMGQASASATSVPLMGASDIFSAPVNDYTAEGAGEMSY